MDPRLDETDVALLAALARNGRLSRRELAKRLGISTPTVSSRLARLEEWGVIAGYAAELRPEALGQSRIIYLVRVAPARMEAALAKAVTVEGVARVLAGADLLVVEALAGQAKDVSRLPGELGAIEGVRSVDSVPVVNEARGAAPAPLHAGTTVELACAYCGGPVKGKLVTADAGGRSHVFCCATCRREFLAKWERLASAAGPSGGQKAGRHRA